MRTSEIVYDEPAGASCAAVNRAARAVRGNRQFRPADLARSSPADTDGDRAAALPPHAAVRALDTPVLRSLLPLAAGLFSNASRKLELPATGRNEAALFYCVKGEGWCDIRGRRHRLAAGDLCVIPAETSRIYGTDSARAWKIAWIHAAGSNLGFFLEQLGATVERPVIKAGDDARLLGWFLELLDLIGHECTAAELLYASQTLAHLLSALICSGRDKHQAGDTNVSHKIERSIDYMRQHLHEPLRAGRLAAVANMSLPHYFALFKRCVGATPIDYFIKLRMEQARRLLSETSWSVKQVASALGYEDPLYFSRVFKAVNQSTPTDYRLTHAPPR